MKTPREVLLGQHQAANLRLDQIRHVVVAELTPRPPREPGMPFVLKLWCELIWPCRRTWAGLAVVWVVILAVNIAARDPLPVREAHKAVPAPRSILLALKEQEQLLAELTGPLPPRQVEKPKATAPQPRSQRREEYLSA